MSTLTEERQLKTENGIKYMVDIRNFQMKMKTFKPDRPIHSRTFYIEESSFQVCIVKIGELVFVGLDNKSPWKVKLTCDISAKCSSQTYSAYPDYTHRLMEYKHNHSIIWYTTFANSKFTEGDLLKDGTLSLEFNIKLLEEEVTADRNMTGHSVEAVREKVEEQAGVIQELKNLIEENNKAAEDQKEEMKNLKKEIKELTSGIQSLSASLHHLCAPGSRKCFPPSTECPVCMETLRPPMRLRQCGQGHIVCEDCYRQARMDPCHSCRGEITGRPTELERILGLSS